VRGKDDNPSIINTYGWDNDKLVIKELSQIFRLFIRSFGYLTESVDLIACHVGIPPISLSN
jgi:hypothetical protein